MNRRIQKPQRGAATLLITTILLFVVSSASLYATRIAMTEQRISGNDYRAKQAYQAAQAGIDAALSQLNLNIVQAADANGDGQISAAESNAQALNGALQTGGGQAIANYSATYTNVNNNQYDLIQVTVAASAGDGSGSRTVRQRLNFIPTVNDNPLPPAPLIALGTANLSGSSRAINNTGTPGEATVWSGLATTAAGSTTVTASGGDGVYDNDANLAALGGDGLFENFFTEDKNAIKSKANVIDCSTPCNGGTAAIQALDNQGGMVVWIEGDLNLDQAVTIGTAANPVVFIVNGNFTIAHTNAFLNGFVYVAGNWDNGNSRGNVNGAVAVEGNFNSSGNLNLTYSQGILNLVTRLGSYARVAGSWWG